MGPEQQRLTPAERANLIAYLDGELPEPEARAINTKLTHSATARREVEALERTWELLDFLPRPKASENFTARTLTEIKQLDVHGRRFESVLKETAQHAVRAGSWLLVSALALLIGYGLMQWAWPSRSARLARDLPIAEHLDDYRAVGSFEFLEALATSPEFGAEND